MDDSRIPWWLIVCVGIIALGMAAWQSSRWKLSWRSVGAVLALIFVALLALLLGGDPRGAATKPWRFPDIVIVGLSSVSIVAAGLLAGRPRFRGQLAWFATMSLANAGICFVTGARAVAAPLAVVGFVAAGVLLLNYRTLTTAELWPVAAPDHHSEPPTLTWLAATTGFALALILVGANYYAQRAESTRATLTRRHSALPSRSRVKTLLNIQPDQERSVNLLDQLTGRRADVVVLLAVLTFVSLAAWRSPSRPDPIAGIAEDRAESFEPAENS